jgi:hypothetical protein
MTQLAREISLAVVHEEGPTGMFKRLSDPFWFQAFGCVLGFDWHSSGVTTTTCGALKEGLKGLEGDVGFAVAGGKGKTSRRTPAEIEATCEGWGEDPAPLVAASRLSAKVDSSAVQDGFQIYHHTFLFTPAGEWAVVQQGMDEKSGMARRYHWLTPPRFDNDPHEAVTERAQGEVLNLVAGEAEGNRSVATELAREHPEKIGHELRQMQSLAMPRRHELRLSDLDPKRIERVLLPAYEAQPSTFTDLLSVKGVGAKGLRALALVAELTYGEPVSVRDPASFSYAHGGKDGTPFPVDRKTYDATIESLRETVRAAKMGNNERRDAMKRLGRVEARA